MSTTDDTWQSPRENLFAIEKLNYARGKRPQVDCILCSVDQNHPDVANLVIEKTEHSIVSVNLYPYNPGHLIIFPKRHIIDYCLLTEEEASDIHRLTQKSIQVLQKAWQPKGFNLGYNIGKNSGGSIPHIHRHIVPRFPNEAGFLDVFANTRIVIYDPERMQKELVRLWQHSTG